MSANANVARVAWGAAGVLVVVAFVVYVIFKLNEISQGVQTVADNQNRTKADPDNAAPIDVTPEAVTNSPVVYAQVENAIVTQANSSNVAESAIYSDQSEQNGLKAYEKKDLVVDVDSESDSDHSAILTAESTP